MIGLDYKDTIRIVDQTFDGYGDETINESVDVPALFLQSTGEVHALNTQILTSDAHAYIDPTDEFVIENAYRMEGMLVQANPFDGNEDDAWYKIIRVVVGQDKLLTNSIDNVHIYLSKTDARGIDDELPVS